MKKIFLFFVVLILSGCFDQSGQVAHKFYTWDGLEPDRWSSVWLLKRHIDENADISIVPVGAQINNAVAIATPESDIKRTHGFSNYENMVKAYNLQNDVALMRLGKIINEIEISPWQSTTPAVAIVEQKFRALQLKYNRIDVPAACYSGFFDVLYGVLKKSAVGDTEAYLASLSNQLAPNIVCQIPTDTIASKNDLPVLVYPIEHVLKMINANKTVVFVDTREDEEYDEHHIPGAVNLKLREVDATSAKQFEGADLVISYCIKDFRGYEVALALSKVGVKHIGIMKPYGLKGWKDLGLPVANSNVSDVDAIVLLKKRAASGV